MKKILVLVVAILFGTFSYGWATIFDIAGPAQSDIDQSDPLSINLNSAQGGIIQDINLGIVTTPVYADDLTFQLKHGATTIYIYQGLGDTDTAYINAVFDDAASSYAPTSGTVDGTFKPVGPLSSFNGLDLSGEWSLIVWDPIIAGDGTDLLSWGIFGTVGGQAEVPEPTTMLLLGSGLIGLWGARKKFKK